MKSLFRKRKIPFNYNKYYLFVQHKWAERMQAMTTGLSGRTLLCLLILFIVVTTGYLAYNIYAAFSRGNVMPVQNTSAIPTIRTINIKK